jgi:hypothetical protein
MNPGLQVQGHLWNAGIKKHNNRKNIGLKLAINFNTKEFENVENFQHRNFKGFDMIQFFVSNGHVGKFLEDEILKKSYVFPPFQKGLKMLGFHAQL